MQKSALERLATGQFHVELDKAWQMFKHRAEHRGIRPKLRFSAESLPAHYQTQVTSVSSDSQGHYVMKTPLMALAGSRGVMPRTMYRQALSAQFDLGDEAALDFFDSFNNRYFRLYCQTELKHDLCSQLEEETFSWNQHKQSVTTMLSSFGGQHEANDVVPKSHLIQYSGLLGLKLTCPHALKHLLEDYFGAQFVIEPSGLEYQPLTPCSLTQLGGRGQNRQLGMGALLGKHAPMVGQKLNIKLCPKNYRHYLSIRSDQKMIRAIEHLVRSYMGINIKYKLYMKVDSRYLPRVKLASSAESGLKVGQSAWMNSRTNQQQFVEMPLTASE
ncbi:type VI secretion system baseplate subunit TssG [Vibrio tapetis subsp. quintayensis]|uniref:type VI secretion system baseplate subunit TssG n=1 Tax=Vibrio tapetis TaxID=52443 RepID=UPI0025B4FE5F|nr:type VI secretion system baseplate subunit TssG [Vibrio tapetis]MDN3680814.1 type VI secretion system baseplate subunit TssG [Vibrio tapetis subsp. quintayensis]